MAAASGDSPIRKKHRCFVICPAVVLILGTAIQVVPVDRSNPPVTQEIAASPEEMAVLRKSCFDCHSNRARWPWYSYVAPVSWFVANHVHEAREHVNFSQWDQYDSRQRGRIIAELWDEVSEGEMPLSTYLLLHGDARLSPDDLTVLRDWAMSQPGSATGDEDDD